jgi:CRP/FNR family transcriptional regulator
MKAPHPSLVNTLRRVPLFNELSEAELASVAAAVTVRHWEAGETIFCEGGHGGDLLIVQQGSVKILKTASSGRHQLIAIERAGSSLGEVSVFDGGLYSTTAIAIESTVLLRFRGEHFRKLCLANPEVAVKVIKVLGHRLRHLRRLVEELSFSTVRGRLIAHMLRLAEETGRISADGIEIDLLENNEELADRLGTVRELVSRNLGRLHGEGLVTMRRRHVTIRDRDLLRAELKH